MKYASLLSFFLTMFAISAFSRTSATDHTYVMIQTARTGILKAPNNKNARQKEGWMEVSGFKMGTASAAGSRDGAPQGKSNHQTIIFTNEINELSAQLQQAFAAKKILTRVVFQFTRTGQGGKDTFYRTITLTNAVIVRIVRTGNSEEISVTYEKIEEQTT